MLAAGWVIQKAPEETWEVCASGGQRFQYCAGHWDTHPNRIQDALESDEKAIMDGRMSPFVTRSLLTARETGYGTSPLLQRLCNEGHPKGQSVLRFGGGQDRSGHELIVDAGAIRVDEYDPNFYPDPAPLQNTYKLLICLHVLDCIPPSDRRTLFQQIKACTRNDGCAWISLYSASALPETSERQYHQDGYAYRSGHNRVFYKPYTRMGADSELGKYLGGVLTFMWSHPHEFIYCWRHNRPS